MTRLSLRALVCLALLWTGAALAAPTPQQKCDYARITASKVYVSCVDTAVALLGKGVSFDEFAAWAKCRHTYFKNWTAFQPNASLAGSTCIGSRLTDNGTTVTDNLTGLVWEKKTNDASAHDESNFYSWSTGSNNEDGTAFTTFLAAGLNTPGFAGANGWRLPTLAELQTSLRDFACTGAGGGATCNCGSSPCIDATFGPTQSATYWAATSYVPGPGFAWGVRFYNGGVYDYYGKTGRGFVRAVRGGL